ncbi:unnamed protein product [Adineta steineri]|uniref:Uncharacterized protein n=1 Tax=Adineta steineri TaxID=433720 RepID=A0A818UVX7_9BILA|nr:unnamed protein product [Adineta steineri]CAF0785072.1 unnamed protein product [Adineta steineri]CAF1563489.1 unnamed protein product [Adineta steineri]CAF1665721.1 unnamed protein product [Adineta steineri]CAF3663101.1 unnamed protein product [Adineta steineri]
MPIDTSSTEILNATTLTKKKRSHKKRRHRRKLQSKGRNLNENETNDQSILVNPADLNKLTPANLASLRWDNPLTDPVLENERIEHYKELRRQRYIDARQQAIQILMEQMQVTTTNVTENEQQ